MLKKVVCLFMALSLTATLFVGCGKSPSTDESGSTPTSENGETTQNSKQTKPLRWAVKASEAGREEMQNLVDLAAEHGIEVEMVPVPDPVAGEADKLLISLMGGEEFDLVMNAYPNMIPYVNAGVLEPLDSYIKASDYDVDGIFGDYPAVFNGEIYGLPAYVDTAITIYNKKIFDDAGIPYPSAKDWTWEKFIEVGKQLTNESEGIYGAFNPLWAHYNYMYAIQKGAEHYKEDGTCNYDDPLFAEAIEFYYGLGNKEHVNPEFLTQKSRQMPIDYFTTGKVGMSVAGGWTVGWLTDQAKYPRDWKAGILPMPYPEGSKQSTSVVVADFFVPATSSQKELAFECAALFAENMYLMGAAHVPARVNLTEEEINAYIEDQLIGGLADDGITVEDIRAAWFNPDVLPFNEKVVGDASADINSIFTEEGGLYGIGEQDLETTMKNIKERCDKAIADAAK